MVMVLVTSVMLGVEWRQCERRSRDAKGIVEVKGS